MADNPVWGPASGAAILIALIAFLLVLYMLVIPPEFREQILGEDFQPDTPTSIEVGGTAILSKSPGRLDKLASDSIDINLPSALVFKKTTAEVLASKNSIYIRNSLFSEQADEIRFEVADPSTVSNVLLSFNSRRRDGRLVINVNDNVVFNREIFQPTIPPIEVPKQFLNSDNKIEFRVGGAGPRFWHTTEYLLENVQITGNVTDPTTQEAKLNFLVQTKDLINTKQNELSFVPECKQAEVGVLEVFVNDFLLWSGIPLCGDFQKILFLPDKLLTGDNQLIFRTAQGSYVIDTVSIGMKLESPDIPAYYFELSEEQFRNIESGGLLRTELLFADPEQKNLDLIINGHIVHVDISKTKFSYNIGPFVKEGTNAIKLSPRSRNIDVVSLTVDLK